MREDKELNDAISKVFGKCKPFSPNTRRSKMKQCPKCKSKEIELKQVMDFKFYVCKCGHQWRA